MIYKVRYEHDNSYRKDDKVAIIKSEAPLRSKSEVRDFFYRHIYPGGDDFIKIYECEPILNDEGNYILLEIIEG